MKLLLESNPEHGYRLSLGAVRGVNVSGAYVGLTAPVTGRVLVPDT